MSGQSTFDFTAPPTGWKEISKAHLTHRLLQRVYVGSTSMAGAWLVAWQSHIWSENTLSLMASLPAIGLAVSLLLLPIYLKRRKDMYIKASEHDDAMAILSSNRMTKEAWDYFSAMVKIGRVAPTRREMEAILQSIKEGEK
jgi:hypothetical protein